MHFSDDDLKSALRRKEPSPEFTETLMACVARQPAPRRQAPKERERFSFSLRWLMAGRRWQPAGALAALVVVGAAFLEYRHEQQVKAEQAKDKAVLALQITASKLDHVLHHAQRTAMRNSSSPKEHL